jgi:hypothetical protein
MYFGSNVFVNLKIHYSERNKYSGLAAKTAFFSEGHNFLHRCNRELELFYLRDIGVYTSAKN